MKISWIAGSVFLLVGCGGGNSDYRVKSQEERLEEQLGLAEEDAARKEDHLASVQESKGDSEEAEKFDKSNAEFELKRASNNAVDCPNTLPAGDLKGFSPGELTVNVTFVADGTVKEVKMDRYADSPLGDCIERAFESARVKVFAGSDETVEWKIELKAPVKKVDPKAPAKKK